ncbi:unnamed protein product [Ceutorhynchus assimilis]|uniref:Uncharacterized protein n=1 Tax=Ceutorhynchus assimilis TaxID=467358 RepID=A0A9N9MVH5_9CUCU|nr:unnamed protein product [Ceutorhynchus assimilis]
MKAKRVLKCLHLKKNFIGNKESFCHEDYFVPNTIVFLPGYGSVAPRTSWGKLVTIIYALVGIPLMLLYLSTTGDVLARSFRRLYAKICGSKATLQKLQQQQQRCGCSNNVRVPVTLCLVIVLAYICSGAMLFHRLENWSLLDGSYFCFTSLGTIGFGDLLPGQNVEEISLCACSAYILTGMALVAMCFSLVQDEVMALLRIPAKVLKHDYNEKCKPEKYLQKYNYPIETHQVTTDDGFVLTLHRIPARESTNSGTNSSQKSPAALLIPGISCTSMDFVNLGPGRALGLLMADLGYDIWLVNPRGTRYSMKHQTLNRSEAEFWEFSFHEKGYYDLAANIDYIISFTGLDKFILELLNFHGLPYYEEVSILVVQGCNIIPQTCANFVQMLVGYDYDQIDLDLFLVFLSDKPNGIGTRQLYHYGQEMITDSFREFDYGIEGNLIHYGKSVPPKYDVSKITAPVAAYYAQNDFFASIKDVEKLLSEMPNVVDQHLVDYELFNHLDFITAKDIKDLLYDRLLETINKYNNFLLLVRF